MSSTTWRTCKGEDRRGGTFKNKYLLSFRLYYRSTYGIWQAHSSTSINDDDHSPKHLHATRPRRHRELRRLPQEEKAEVEAKLIQLGHPGLSCTWREEADSVFTLMTLGAQTKSTWVTVFPSCWICNVCPDTGLVICPENCFCCCCCATLCCIMMAIHYTWILKLYLNRHMTVLCS